MDNKLRGFGRGRAAGGKLIYCGFLKKLFKGSMTVSFEDYLCKALCSTIFLHHTIFLWTCA